MGLIIGVFGKIGAKPFKTGLKSFMAEPAREKGRGPAVLPRGLGSGEAGMIE
jgi:hypothetical protein